MLGRGDGVRRFGGGRRDAGRRLGELLFTADTLADAECYRERDWGKGAVARALELCVEAAKEI